MGSSGRKVREIYDSENEGREGCGKQLTLHVLGCQDGCIKTSVCRRSRRYMRHRTPRTNPVRIRASGKHQTEPDRPSPSMGPHQTTGSFNPSFQYGTFWSLLSFFFIKLFPTCNTYWTIKITLFIHKWFNFNVYHVNEWNSSNQFHFLNSTTSTYLQLQTFNLWICSAKLVLCFWNFTVSSRSLVYSGCVPICIWVMIQLARGKGSHIKPDDDW